VILDAAVGAAFDALEDLHDRTNGDLQPGLFQHLARQRLLERFTELHAAAGQAPFPFERFVSALDQQDAIAVQNHGADANDRLRRKLPQILTSSNVRSSHP